MKCQFMPLQMTQTALALHMKPKLVPQKAIPQQSPLNLRKQRTALGSTVASPAPHPKKSDRRRSESLDMARIVTKESTVLLKDIYNDVQSTLRKYDEMIKEQQENKQRNDSLRQSGIKSMSGSARRSPSRKESTATIMQDQAIESQIKTLKEQQQLLLLMLQNNSVQEQMYQQLGSRTIIQQPKIHITDTRTTVRQLSQSKFKQYSQMQENRSDNDDILKESSTNYHTPAKEQSAFQIERITSNSLHQTETPPPKVPLKKSGSHTTEKALIEISLKKSRKRKLSSSVLKPPESSMSTFSPQSNIPQRQFFPDQQKGGYAFIHGKRKASPTTKQSTNSRVQEFTQKNQLWRDRIGDKILTQKETKRRDEMKECTFKPNIGRKPPPIPTIKADSTQSDLQRDLREIVSILDEFQDFKQFIEQHK